jgi:Tfp pilus assembly protein PilO
MPENLQNNPWFQLVLVLLLGAAIIYAGREFWPNTVQMRTDIARIKEDIGKLQKEVDEGRKLEARLPELEAEIKRKQLELESLKKIIPSTPEPEDLIRKVERMAAETSIAVQSWNIRKPTPQEFYEELPIDLSAGGSYHNLGKFFSKISNYARIINIRGVQLRAVSPPNATQTLTATFTAVTYVYKEDGK